MSRPHCKEICCWEGGDQFLLVNYGAGKSIYEIAKICGSSARHINLRLIGMGVKMRKRSDYPPPRRGRQRSKLWDLSDQDLFETPVEGLVERFGKAKSTITRVRQARRRGEKANKRADE